MKRRTFLKATAATPLLSTPVAADNQINFTDFAEGFFGSLPESQAGKRAAIRDAAEKICDDREKLPEESLESLENSSESSGHLIRRARFGVRTLNEFGITNAVDETMLQNVNDKGRKAKHYVPLINSFINLSDAACKVGDTQPREEGEIEFLKAALAFGIEVALWTTGAPYKVAWNGTRYVANRSFLRFAKHGCAGCVALVMSELHWAIRGFIYGQVSEDQTDYVLNQFDELRKLALKAEYEVDLASPDQIRELLLAQPKKAVGALEKEKESWIDRLISDFKFPDLSDFIP